MEAQVFVDKLYSACEKNKLIDAFQIVYGQSISNSISVFEGKLDKSSAKEVQNVHLKVIVRGKSGSFGCEELSDDNVALMVQQAVENAQVIDDEDENFFYDGSGVYPQVVKPQPLWKRLEQTDIVKFLQDLEAKAYALDSRIKKVINTSYHYREDRQIMRNSLGLNLESEDKIAYASIYLSAKEGEVTKTGAEVTTFEKEEDFDIEKLAAKAVEEAVKKLSAQDITSQKSKIIFKNETFGEFLGVIKSIFSANAVQEKRSKLVGKLGEKIASPAITLIDDATLEKGYGTREFDAEGYPSQKNIVVENGILKTFLHNLRTAHKDKVSSTGNGSGGNEVSFGNFYIKPGEKSQEELLKKVGNGIYIDDLSGMHAGYSMVSGDFSFMAGGFLIEDGKITKPLNPFTISGNVYQLLQEIEEVGNDLDFRFSQTGAPSIVVKELMIANE